MDGWVKLHRKIWETSFSKRPSVAVVFIYLLTHANHQKTTMLWSKEHEIQAGQLVTGRKSIAEQTGLTQQMVRTALVNLQLTNTITIKPYSKFSVITVCNWNKYQESTNRTTKNQPTTNQQATTYNNVKNDKKREESLTTNMEKAPYKNISYLQAVPESDMESLRTGIKVTPEQIRSKAEDLYNYCRSKNKSYSDYRAFLRNALKRDFPEILKVTPGYRVVNG